MDYILSYIYIMIKYINFARLKDFKCIPSLYSVCLDFS